MRVETYNIYGYRELSALIGAHFGWADFDLQQFYQWPNDTVETADLSADQWVDEELLAEGLAVVTAPGYQWFEHRGDHPEKVWLPWASLVLVLIRAGVLPAGRYMVEICW